jgi:1-acyl-sn-glycerol-3-phosphate acyltransferase
MTSPGPITIALLLLLGIIVTMAAWRLTHGPMPTRRLNVLRHLSMTFSGIWHGLSIHGTDQIPVEGPVILASNHTTGLDPLLLQSGCPRRIRWVMLTTWRYRWLEPVWRVVEPITLEKDADGPGDVRELRQIVRELKRGEVVGLFPEGELERDQGELKAFNPGIAVIAKRSGAPILPAFIEGTPRRKSMVWHFLQPSRCRVTFGEPYYPDPHESRQQLLATLRQRIEALGHSTGARSEV